MQSTTDSCCCTVDYSKWNRLDLDDSGDDSASVRVLSALRRCKSSIDLAFEESLAQCCGSSQSSVNEQLSAIVERYKGILSSLASLDDASDDRPQLDLSLGVYLNMSCAYLKLQQWSYSLDCSHEALRVLSGETDDWNKRLRATYFAVCALLRIVPLRLSELQRAVHQLRTAVQLHRTDISPSQCKEYDDACVAFSRKCKAVYGHSDGFTDGQVEAAAQPVSGGCSNEQTFLDRDGCFSSQPTQLASNSVQSHFSTRDVISGLIEATSAAVDVEQLSSVEVETVLQHASSSYALGDHRAALQCYRLALRVRPPIPSALTAVAQYGLGACVLSVCSPDEQEALSDAQHSLLESIHYFEAIIFAPAGVSSLGNKEESPVAISALMPDIADAEGAVRCLPLHVLHAYRMVIRATLLLHLFARCEWLWNRAIDVCNSVLLDLERSMRLNDPAAVDMLHVSSEELVSAVRRGRIHFLIEKALHCMDIKEKEDLMPSDKHRDLDPDSGDFLVCQCFAVLPSVATVDSRDDAQQCLVHRELFGSCNEAAAALLSFAADECMSLDICDVTPAVGAFKALAVLCMDSTSPRIELFDLRAHRQLSPIDLALRAVDCWGRVSALSRRAISNTHNPMESYRHRQQCMLADYHAGVCALALEDLVLAQRCFEASQSVQRDIDKSLRQLCDTVEDLSGYYTTCGDLSYHLGHTYFRLGRYAEVVEESMIALAFYQQSLAVRASGNGKGRTSDTVGYGKGRIAMRDQTAQERLRQRQALTLRALADAALGDTAAAEVVLKDIAALCLGPVEHAEEEVGAVQQLMHRMRDQRTDASTSSRISSKKVSPALPSQQLGRRLDATLVPLDGTRQRDRSDGSAVLEANSSSSCSGGQVFIDWDLVIAYSILVAAISVAVLIAYRAFRLLN